MIGWDDVYITRCGTATTSWLAYTDHQRQCPECVAIGFKEWGIKPAEPENDADDRGICYEDD